MEIDETCPECKVVHWGFDPTPKQKHSFWNCRKCDAELITILKDGNWVTESMATQSDALKQIREMHNSILGFQWHLPYSHDLRKILGVLNQAQDRTQLNEAMRALNAEMKANHPLTH
jgi:hypothetical protein